MMIAARNAFLMSGNAPLPYDAEVEWLQSDGAAIVDTGIIPTPDTGFDISFFPLAPSAFAFFCDGGTWRDSYALYVATGSPNNAYLHLANGTQYGNSTSVVNRLVSASLRNRALVIDGVAATIPVFTYIYTNPMMIFRADGLGKMRVYSCAIYSASVLVRDFIPVRVGSGSSAVGYLYDRVSGELFGNAGTGAFVIGPDK